ncbi:MAG: LysM domain-containing protein [Pseudomonadota bacterium]|nr:LysM domain-containing protein [Pseudomonadota bacterium]
MNTAVAATDSLVAYTVVEGEDIQTVAGNYDVTVEEILVSNGLETEEITV